MNGNQHAVHITQNVLTVEERGDMSSKCTHSFVLPIRDTFNPLSLPLSSNKLLPRPIKPLRLNRSLGATPLPSILHSISTHEPQHSHTHPCTFNGAQLFMSEPDMGLDPHIHTYTHTHTHTRGDSTKPKADISLKKLSFA